MSSPASISVRVTSRVVHVKVEGKGSFQISPALKEFSRQMMDRGHRIFVVDLNNCPGMDSTFMGTLAGIALGLRKLGDGSLLVCNVNDRNSHLLRNLGLNKLFEVESKVQEAVAENPVAAAPLDAGRPVDRSDQAACMIEAHEALVDADPENYARFKDVLEYLKQDRGAGLI